MYPAFSLNGSEGEIKNSPYHQRSLQRRRNNNHTYQEPNNYRSPSPIDQQQQQQQHQHTYQQPFCSPPPTLHQNSIGGGYTESSSNSDNASDATLTDSELVLARDSTLVVRNGKFIFLSISYHSIFS